MPMNKYIFILASLFISPLASAAVLMMGTDKGAIDFSVPESWVPITMKNEMPIALMEFQLPNPAAKGTPHSTVVSIAAYDDNNERSKAAASMIGKALSNKPPLKSTYKDWQMYSQQAANAGTDYTIVDAAKKVTGATIHVRIALPHLAASKTYNDQLSAEFLRFLDSVNFDVFPW